ncbi:MAG: hypothetical protein KIS65_00890 [Nitrosomonas sp.]|nr:hypothetical protein [Nitrosomonas sp.]
MLWPCGWEKKHTPGLIALSVPELRQLLSHLLWHTSQAIDTVENWSVA